MLGQSTICQLYFNGLIPERLIKNDVRTLAEESPQAS